MNPAVRAAGALLDAGLRARDRIAGPPRGVTLVGWHRIDDAPGGLSTSVAEFRRHLDVLDQWGARVVDLDAATDDPKTVVLTFDDGYASVADTAWPLLKERGWPATLYAVAGYLDGGERFPWDERAPGDTATLLDAAGLRDLSADGMAVGSHTVTHRWLPHLAPDVINSEVRESKTRLEDLLQQPVPSFSYPMGGWNPSVRQAVADAGYTTAVTVDRGRNTTRTDRLALRRAFAPRDPADFRRLLDGAYTFLRPVDRWRTRSGPAWQD